MKLRSFSRPRIFVRTDHPVPAANPATATLVGTGTRLVPTVYEGVRAQRRRRNVAMAWCVLLPTVMAAAYFWLIASDRYISDTQMVLKDQAGAPGLASLGAAAGGAGGASALLSLVGMGAGAGSGASDDSAIVVSYLQSPQAIDALDRKIGLRKMWSNSSIDYVSRLSSDASIEDLQKYYAKHVSVTSDPLDPVIELQVEAFRPQDAQLIATTLVSLAQAKLNTTYQGMRQDALGFARSEVARAQKELASIDDKLRDFRNQHGEIDPAAAAQGVGGVAVGLFAQLQSAEAQLRMTQSYARDKAPAVKALKTQIAALRSQIARTRGMLAGGQDKKTYSDLLATYQHLLTDQTLAQGAYESAVAFLASRRAALAHQQTYLIDFLAPTLPQDALEPRSTSDVAIVFFASVLLWLTGSLVASALREHARG